MRKLATLITLIGSLSTFSAAQDNDDITRLMDRYGVKIERPETVALGEDTLKLNDDYVFMAVPNKERISTDYDGLLMMNASKDLDSLVSRHPDYSFVKHDSSEPPEQEEGRILEGLKGKIDTVRKKNVINGLVKTFTYNSSAIVKYSVPYKSHIMIRVYDVLGRIISESDKGWQEPQEYVEFLDMKDKSSGMYFVVMQLRGQESENISLGKFLKID